MNDNLNALNSYSELIKYATYKVQNNEYDFITKNVLQSINKSINEIKILHAQEQERQQQTGQIQINYQNRDYNHCQEDDYDQNQIQSYNQNQIQDVKQEDNQEDDPVMLYYKVHPKQINRLEKFNKSIYLY